MSKTFLLPLLSATLLVSGCQERVNAEASPETFEDKYVFQKPAGAQKPDAQKEQPSPKPEHKPEAVIGFQLEAMRMNDSPTPDSGIKTAFRFASPENRLVTGPIEKFISLVKNPIYRPLLNHKEATREAIRVLNNAAQQRVRITTADGDVVFFIFTLSKQESGEYKDCWMTEAVEREEEVERKDDRRRIARQFKFNLDEVTSNPIFQPVSHDS